MLVQLVAMAMPEWVVERAPSASTYQGSSSSDPSILAEAEAGPVDTDAASSYTTPAPAMKAHLGLFHVSYRVQDKRSEGFYGFCSPVSPASSLEKCLTWRAAQAAALASGALAYAALILLLVAASATLKTRAVEYTVSWSWTLFFMGGLAAWGACVSFLFLSLTFRREHRKREDGYSVELGASLWALAAIGCVYILLPFLRMNLHKAGALRNAAAGPAVAEVNEGVNEEETAVADDDDEDNKGGEQPRAPTLRGREHPKRAHHHNRPQGVRLHHHHHHQHHHHQQHHDRQRRHSRDMAAGGAAEAVAVVVVAAADGASTRSDST